MKEPIVALEEVSVRLGGALLLDRLDWIIQKGEQWALTGPSGSGKTVLAHTVLGRHFHTGEIRLPGAPSISIVEQHHRFRNKPGSTELYYQQRFNSFDADQTITVSQELAESGFQAHSAGASEALHTRGAEWLEQLHILPLLDRPLIQLSNGENKRVQLAIALLDRPDLLILDHPFLGLDNEGRELLRRIISDLAIAGMQFLLITGPHEIPDSITHVGHLEKGTWKYLGSRAGFHPEQPILSKPAWSQELLARITRRSLPAEDFSVAVKIEQTTIRYGNTNILEDIDWEVRKGERWNLSGPNGSGKSTLLSLITADNPQAYANRIRLFDRPRGSGETIWDIKKKIGFVSPELHLYFDRAANVFDVIASGLFDTIGLFRPISPDQEALTLLWMAWTSISNPRRKRLFELSAGEQRRTLLARALIKDPPMLILDEPCQGLDEDQTAAFRNLIDMICDATDTTLIYVSHYSSELPACINKFLELKAGRIIRRTG